MMFNRFLRPLRSRLAEIEAILEEAPSKEEGSARVLAFATSSEIAALVAKVSQKKIAKI
jgi:hypothetical protein